MSKQGRAIIIDAWRGMAITAMVLFHALVILAYFDVVPFLMFSGGWLFFSRLIQWSFLLLVGIAMVFAYHGKEWLSNQEYAHFQLKRAAIIGAWALVITLVTWLLVPNMYVRFGILHLIAVSIVMSIPVVLHPRAILPAMILVMTVIAIFSDLETSSELLYALGIPLSSGVSFISMDFFQVFPWVFCVYTGVALGQYLRNPKRFTRLVTIGQKSRVLHILASVGKRTLRIYIAHVPLLLALFHAIQLIDMREIL